MPLRDHYHPPLSEQRHAEGLNNAFASAIADLLNLQVLPEDYVAEFQVHVTARIEVDVGTFDYAANHTNDVGDGGRATATLPAAVWAPPAPALQMPAVYPENIEIQILNVAGGPRLVAAIEIVSPANKDRPEVRHAFAVKCASYLQQGVGLVIVDLVTLRRGNLHNALIDLLGTGEEFKMPAEQSIYVVAYRPVRTSDVERIDLWPTPLNIGDSLPVVPLALGTGPCVPLELETAYVDTFRRVRLA